MNRTMITATNTMSQIQHKMDIIGHNISNVQTNGFKRKESYFNDLLVQQFETMGRADRENGRLTANGVRQGTGAKISQAKILLTQGSLKTTDRDLDVALKKKDLFFKVLVQGEQEQSVNFTRDGAFYLSPDSQNPNNMMVVTGNGYPVLDEFDDPIVVNGNIKEIAFSENGQLRVTSHDGGAETFNLGIVSVKKPQFLEQIGGNLLGFPANMDELAVAEGNIVTALTGAARGEISLQQRSLEASNVDLSKEMTDLMNMQRHYQFQARSITLADQMQSLVNGIR
ncbi:flagellar hook-basal body protein [Peribacillus saganii]|uniref:Flagellar hook-basal body protein n=1 Tax=Peribacillus saganii TaxID=2303992 RepID=A0A372LKE0_9BACI|nr:flagellar hook-basal body protein [Peribacillus saganii]RFU67093.1 flagellar hook-basal body protein [Peribacillus saganii]